MTITVNLHSGLAAWASGAFTLGQRCSSGGNAYQCTTAGSATAAPTGTGGVIPVTGGAVFKWLSAVDYTSIVTMTAAFSGTLTDNVVMLIWNNGLIIINDLSVGATTPGSFTTTMKPAPGESWRDNVGAGAIGLASPTLGVMIESQINYTNVIRGTAPGIILYGLQISGNGNSYQVLYNTTGNLIVDCCIIQGTSYLAKFYCDIAGGNIINNVFISRSAQTVLAVEVDGASPDIVTFMNNLIIRPSNFTAGGIGVDGNMGIFSNNAIFGYTTAPTGSIWSGSNNASNVAACIPPGTTGNLSTVAFTTATFIQPSAASVLNVRLPSSSALVDAAVTNALIPVDALGTSRPQNAAPDIGPLESMAAYIPRTPIVVYFG